MCNYAVRRGWNPLFVDLDLGQGGITCPATVGAVPIDRPIDVADGLPLEMPLVYFHGDASPGNNPDLYKFLVERVGGMLDARHGSNPAARASGVVVNTMGWVDGAGYKLLLHALDALKITDVLVVGQERLHAELRRDMRGKTRAAGPDRARCRCGSCRNPAGWWSARRSIAASPGTRACASISTARAGTSRRARTPSRSGR